MIRGSDLWYYLVLIIDTDVAQDIASLSLILRTWFVFPVMSTSGILPPLEERRVGKFRSYFSGYRLAFTITKDLFISSGEGIGPWPLKAVHNSRQIKIITAN